MDPSNPFLSDRDRRHDAARSAVLRYRRVPSFEADPVRNRRLTELLEQLSIREGLRIFHLVRHRGVNVYVLDETSLMHTSTLKSIDGCVTTARCLLEGYRRICFESGGNTGTALTAYGSRAGLETFLFIPSRSLPLLDSELFAGPGAHLVAVDDPARVKSTAERFAAYAGIPRVPRADWRRDASMIIGCFVLEQLLEGMHFDFLYQTISAAFAPIGIYRILREHGRTKLPAFVGVQQSALCPMFRMWTEEFGGTLPTNGARPLSSVMYDGNPQGYGTYEELRRILNETGGRLTTLDHRDFDVLGAPIHDGRSTLDLLRDNRVPISIRNGEVLEKTGLIALARVCKEIEAGSIRAGARVLVCLTGGTASPDGLARPDYRVRDDEDHSEHIARVLRARPADA